MFHYSTATKNGLVLIYHRNLCSGHYPDCQDVPLFYLLNGECLRGIHLTLYPVDDLIYRTPHDFRIPTLEALASGHTAAVSADVADDDDALAERNGRDGNRAG